MPRWWGERKRHPGDSGYQGTHTSGWRFSFLTPAWSYWESKGQKAQRRDPLVLNPRPHVLGAEVFELGDQGVDPDPSLHPDGRTTDSWGGVGPCSPQTLDTAVWILISARASAPSFAHSSHVNGSPGSCVAWRLVLSQPEMVIQTQFDYVG